MTGIAKPTYWKILAACLLAGIGGFFALLWYAGHVAYDQRAAAARDIQQLCGVIYLMVDRQGRTLGRPGTPGYAYYRGHPDELELAKKQAKRSLAALPCGPP